MKQSVDKYDFRKAFLDIRPDQFSLVALDVLFEYLEDYENQTGQEMELDVIALCCDYYESSWQDIAREYSIDLNDADAEAEDYEQQCFEIVQQYLEDNTGFVSETHIGHFIYQAF